MSILLAKLMNRVYMAPENDEGAGAGAGAGGGEGGEAVGTGNDARVALLNRIGQQSEEHREGEFEEHPEGDEAAAAEAAAALAEAEAEAARLAAEAAAAAAEQRGAGAAQPQKFKVKVNGVEQELTLDEVLQRAQKVESADQYLAEAARLRNELAAQRAGGAAAEQHEDSVDEDLALARAIQMGSEEEAVAAIRKMRGTGPSKDDLAHTIDERLTFNVAIAQFRKDFADIAEDPYLNSLAWDMDSKMIANNDRRPYSERYTEIGNTLRNWVADKAKKLGGAGAGDQGRREDKQSRKEAAPAAPAAASGKAASTVEEEREESTSEVIANMAAARGGPQWMRGAPTGE